MRWLKSVAREIYGLFVDEGSLAATLLAWMVAAAGLRFLHLGHWSGPVFFFGLAAILAENAVRTSRRIG